MHRYIRFVLNHPVLVLILAVGITLVLAAGIGRLKLDTSLETFLPQTDPAYQYYEKVKKTYGDVGSFVILSVSAERLWAPETFERMNRLLIDLEAYQDYDKEREARRMETLSRALSDPPVRGGALFAAFDQDPAFKRLLHRKLSALDWRGPAEQTIDAGMARDLKRAAAEARSLKKQEMIDEIISPFTVRDITGEGGMLSETRLIPVNDAGQRVLPETPAEFAAFKESLRRNPAFEKGIYATDDEGRITNLGVLIRFSDMASSDPIAREILEIADSHDELDIICQGEPIVYIKVNDYMYRDLTRLVPLVMVVAVLVFFINFRSLRGVVLPFMTLSMSTLWILGLMGWLGVRITAVGVSIPVLMIAVGSSYGIHILNQYYAEFDGISEKGKKKGLEDSMSHISMTVLLTGLTTFVAFMTLATHELNALRDWGIFCAIGIMFAVLISSSVIPAGLELLPHQPRKRGRGLPQLNLVDAGIRLMGRLATAHYGKVLVAVLLLIPLSIIGLTHLRVETALLQFFKKGDPIRTSARQIGDKFGGRWGFMILIDSGEVNGAKSAEFLKTIEEFRGWLEAEENADLCIGRTDAFSDFVKTMHMAMHNDKPGYYRIPEKDMTIMDYLEIFSGRDENSDGRADRFEAYVDPFFQTCNVIARLDQKNGEILGSAGLEHIFNRISAHLDQNLPDKYDYRITGHPKMGIKSVDYIVGGQIQSLLLTFVVIGLVVLLLLRNAGAALLSLIPMSIAVMINFGVMGGFGIPLDIVTSIIAAITIGIGVDDTIHFFNTFRSCRACGADMDAAIHRTLQVAGKAIIFTSLALICGFSVLTLSPFKPLLLFGYLMALTMGATTIGALVVLPAAVKLTGTGQPAAERPRITVPRLPQWVRHPGGLAGGLAPVRPRLLSFIRRQLAALKFYPGRRL